MVKNSISKGKNEKKKQRIIYTNMAYSNRQVNMSQKKKKPMLQLKYEGPGIPYSEVWIVFKKIFKTS